ncbi:MAG: SMP-30/gluconolactonase/LRE family protein [Woeseiaceae bacterium]|nr:SMP-30/gluconolactonase/LRE family protein [Woeseiaceae bacterium]
MRRAATTVVALLAVLLLYLLLWPVPVDPVAWDAPEDRGLTGVFAPNDWLRNAEAIDLGLHEGPEDVALGPDGFLYASSHGGSILKISPDDGNVSVFSRVGGRPLGIEFDSDGSLLVANAYLGLQRVSRDGDVSLLLSEIDGQPLVYADDVDVAADGTVYFSEASTKFGAEAADGTLDASLLDILEHGGNGLIVAFDPADGTARVVLDGLNFANGVAVSEDQQYLLIAETGSYRILKHWLAGPSAGETEVLIDNLPGFPDNINNGLNGRFWVGLVSPRSALLDRYSASPFIRKVMQRLPAFVRPKPIPSSHVIAINGDGQVLMDLQDPRATYPMLTGVLETRTKLYLSSLVGQALPVLDKDELAPR